MNCHEVVGRYMYNAMGMEVVDRGKMSARKGKEQSRGSALHSLLT